MRYEDKKQELEGALESINQRIKTAEDRHWSASLKYGRAANTFIRPSQGLYKEREYIRNELKSLEYVQEQILGKLYP